MSIYDDELDAERTVNKALLKELARRYPMDKLLKLHSGEIIRVTGFEVVTEEELNAIRLEKIDELAVLNGLLDIDSNPDKTVSADIPVEQTEQPTPVQSEVPAAPEVAQPQTVLNPDGTVTQVAQPAPEQPLQPQPIQLQ